MMVRLAERHEHEASADALGHLEPERIAIEVLGAIQIRDLQVNVSYLGHVF
jgi:hypothetical protein